MSSTYFVFIFIFCLLLATLKFHEVAPASPFFSLIKKKKKKKNLHEVECELF